MSTAGWSRDFWGERRPRREGSHRRSRPCWTYRTNRAKGRTWSSRTTGERKLPGRLSVRWCLSSLSSQMMKTFIIPLAPWAQVHASVLIPCMENGAATDVSMQHPARLCKGRLLFSFCSAFHTPHLGAAEGQIGRKMETEKKKGWRDVGVLRALQSSKNHLCVLQTFHTHCTQPQLLCNVHSRDQKKKKKRICMHWFKVQSRFCLQCYWAFPWKVWKMFGDNTDI